MKKGKGLVFKSIFVARGEDPYAGVQWVKRESVIRDRAGKVIFAQDKVIAPSTWSQLAVDIAASKYFRRESSVKDLINRVVDTITAAGVKNKYFSSSEAEIFSREIKYLCVRQMAAFNSPVWFNCGVPARAGGVPARAGGGEVKPQCSACFILSVDDDLMSIFELAKTEAKIFKYGSGAGSNFSRLRGKDEPLENGGNSSGVLAFLEVLDRGAGATKSGGTTRRAAKMVTLDADHPEIFEFIEWKMNEEAKAKVLMKAGYGGGLDGEAYRSVSGQNSNNSVRLNDRFLKAVASDGDWSTRARVGGAKLKTFKAKDLWSKISEAAWTCADPGVQFHDTINKWHTCPKSGPIRASNPCSEYMFVDDSACNLASLNLSQFLKDDATFDVEGFKHAVRLIFTAQEILVTMSSYPTEVIAKNSADLRPLGIGYANLGGLLLRLGLPYDSENGRAWAACVTAIMTGTAYATSAELAKNQGSFAAYKANKLAMLKVIKRHQNAVKKISKTAPLAMRAAAANAWSLAIREGIKNGFRNSQASVLAPTGTIGLFMDCETTGIEPDFSLVKLKYLAGGGEVRIVNQAVDAALKRLGYGDEDRQDILDHLRRRGDITTHPQLKSEHHKVFDTAQPPSQGGRYLSSEAHLTMMAAVQPFLSGAISKTVNLPASAKVADVAEVYWRAWQLGLKAIAVYRDNSKGVQPLVMTPTCSQCGHHTVRAGNCFKCLNCGHSESCG